MVINWCLYLCINDYQCIYYSFNIISKSFKIYSRFKCFSQNQSYFSYYLVHYYVFICTNTFSRVSKLQQKGRRIEHFQNLMTTTVPKESLRTNYFQRGGTSVFCNMATNSSLIWQKNAIISEVELSAFMHIQVYFYPLDTSRKK
jgi:hypothetical protein